MVAIPALNEEATIADVVATTPRTIPGIESVEILVVDDGSVDDTALLALESGARVIRHPRQRGLGVAFHTALEHGIERGADIIVTIDADAQFNPQDIPILIRPVVDGEADFATASRFKDPTLTPEMSQSRLWGNRMMSRFISRLSGRQFFDVSCGMRCYGRRAALQLYLMGQYTYTQEVFLNLAFKNCEIAEVPLKIRGTREHGKSRVARNLWTYGIRTARIIFRWYRDYHPFQFFGGLGLALFAPSAWLVAFLLSHYATTGALSPHKWAGFVAAAFVLLAVILIQTGIVGDMLVRHRVYLEEVLYRQRSEAKDDRASNKPASALRN